MSPIHLFMCVYVCVCAYRYIDIWIYHFICVHSTCCFVCRCITTFTTAYTRRLEKLKLTDSLYPLVCRLEGKEAYRTRDKGKGPGEEWKEEGKRREGKSRRINGRKWEGEAKEVDNDSRRITSPLYRRKQMPTCHGEKWFFLYLFWKDLNWREGF